MKEENIVLLESALSEYDRTRPFREAMLNRAETIADVAVYESAEEKALKPLRYAFYEATRDVALNNRAKCNLVQVDDVRRVVQSLRREADDRARAPEVIDVPIEARIGGWASPVSSSSRRARP